jgi:hypothetical protein
MGGANAYFRSGGKASAGFSELLNQRSGSSGGLTDAQRRRMGDVAIQAYRRAQAGWNEDGTRGAQIQYEDRDVKVKVTNGYSRVERGYTTDILVIHRDRSVKQHLHVVIAEEGHEITHEWRNNH